MPRERWAYFSNTGSGFQQMSPFASGGSGTNGITAAHFNPGGNLDLAVTNALSGTTSVFFGAGDGNFQPAGVYQTGTVPSQVVATDVNGDGQPDLIVVDQGMTFGPNGGVYVLLNQGGGNFGAPVFYPAGVNPIAASVADVNGDGRPDIIVGTNDSNFNGYLAIFLNKGGGGFNAPALIGTEAGPSSIAIQDFNGDGKPDLVIAHCCGQDNLTYRQGNGDGTFSLDVDFNGGEDPSVVQVVSFIPGGGPDLAITHQDGSMVGLLNVAQPGPGTIINVSAAADVPALAPGSLATAFGTGLASSKASAPSTPLPVTLDGTSVGISDSAGNTTAAPLVFVDPSQVNSLIPASVAVGPATITVTGNNGTQSSGPAQITTFGPALFTLNATNLAAAVAVCTAGNGSQTVENVYQVSNGAILPSPLDLSRCTETVLSLFGTGMDAASASNVQVSVAGGASPLTVLFAGPQGTFIGLDQINVVLPPSLAGHGNVSLAVTIDGQTANFVNVTIR